MKMLRLIVSIRLASFSLIFNLSIAQELEVNTENFVILTQSETNVEEDEPENETPMDSYVADASQNDEWDTEEPHPSPLLLGEGSLFSSPVRGSVTEWREGYRMKL